MHTVHLTEPAYLGFQRLASKVGLSVDEYLNEVGATPPADDGFVMTPEIFAAVKRGLGQLDQGKSLTVEETRQRLQEYKAQWREKQAP